MQGKFENPENVAQVLGRGRINILHNETESLSYLNSNIQNGMALFLTTYFHLP